MAPRQVDEAIDRIKEISRANIGRQLPDYERATIENEIRLLSGNIFEALDDAAQGVSDYMQEKLTGLTSFALMAIGSEDRGSYSDTKILENISHFSYLVKTRQ